MIFLKKLFIFKKFLWHLVNIHYIYYKEFSYITQKNIVLRTLFFYLQASLISFLNAQNDLINKY